MSTTVTSSEDATRELLARVLASESRNALARVELAASELARFEMAPNLQDRVSTIRLAVEEIDGLLSKIDLLAEPTARSRWEAIELEEVARRVCSRLMPSLHARGLSLDWQPGEAALCVELPRPALEAFICSFLRVGLSILEIPGRVDARVSQRAGKACFTIAGGMSRSATGRDSIDRETALELEVELAEWQGILLADFAAGRAEIGFGLTLGSADE